MKPKIIFTIVNYNTKGVLDKCLESIRKTQNNHAVFVVDNASADGSSEMVKKKYSKANLIQNKENIGFGKAHNMVLKSQNYDFAVITNSDIIFLDEIEKTINFLEENNKIGACSIKLLNENNTVQKNVYPIPTLALETMARLPMAKNPYSGHAFDYEKTGKVECFNGACFVVRKKAMEEASFFDEDYFAYAEETDLFLRMQRLGWEIYYCPNTKAVHLGGHTTKEKDKRHQMYFNSLLKFFRKNYGKKKELGLRAIAATSSAASLLKCLVLSARDKKKLKEARFNLGIIKTCLSGVLQ